MMIDIITHVLVVWFSTHGFIPLPSISTVNKKMDLPSFSVIKGFTCPDSAPCKNECYINGMSRQYTNYDYSQLKNFMNVVYRPDFTIDYLVSQIKDVYKAFRFNVSGDIFSTEYYRVIVSVCEQCPGTHFWTYTKQYEIVKAGIEKYGKPDNLTIYRSFWGTYTDNGLLSELPIAYVKLNCGDNADIPTDTKKCNCTVKCKDCKYCISGVRSNVVFEQHGTPNKPTTKKTTRSLTKWFIKQLKR